MHYMPHGEHIPRPVVDMLSANNIRLNEISDTDDEEDDAAAQTGYCSSQEYEIMKDNLLLYCHTRLMTQDNNHSKDFLVSIMFSHYDQNNNGLLEMEELALATRRERLHMLSNGCALDDMLVFDDANSDRVLNINEFYQAFNKMYSLSVVSLDKALQTNRLSARVGENVAIRCDVSGLPAPPIIWRRYATDLSASAEDGIQVLADGSLYLTDIQLINAGNYSCHAQRNKDVMQTHILSVHSECSVLFVGFSFPMLTKTSSTHTPAIPSVRVWPDMQSRRPGESSEILCRVVSEPLAQVVWLKNNEPLDAADTRLVLSGNGTALRIHNATYTDTGAYACRATNIGGVQQAISSLIVQDEPIPSEWRNWGLRDISISAYLRMLDFAGFIDTNRHLFVYHEDGIDVYESDTCRLHHRMFATDRIVGTSGQSLCNGTTFSTSSSSGSSTADDADAATRTDVPTATPPKCSWGRSIVVGRHLLYVSQPTLDRILIISTVQMMVVEVIETDRFPVNLQYVPHLDQVWLMNWRSEEGASTKSIQVIRNASRAAQRHHNAVHRAIAIEGQFDQIKGLFVPAAGSESGRMPYAYRYGYVTHENQRGMYKLDLVRLKYTKSIEFTLYNCVPENVEFSALCK